MPTKKELEILNLIVESMFDRNFEDVLLPYFHENCIRYPEWEDKNLDFVRNYGISFFAGATKVCVISDYVDNWVIKFPYWDESGREYTSDEVDNYEAACNRGLSHFFADTYLLTKMNGHTITIQERVECGYDVSDRLDEKIVDFICDERQVDRESFAEMDIVYEDVSCMDSVDRLDYLIGDSDLSNFVEDFAINDLHTGNFGYRDNGDLVIIDFSGF